MPARRLWPILLVGLLAAGCAIRPTPTTVRLALLAPFEGRYRDIGYEALYAARLALRESSANAMQLELLPVDDGGTVETAVDRARALSLDALVVAVVALGFDAADADTQAAYGDLPVLIVGAWGAVPQRESVYQLGAADLETAVTLPPRLSVTEAAAWPAPFVCADVCALSQFPGLRADLSGVTVVSSGALPDADFATRYSAGDPFAPLPGLLATQTYDAVNLAVSVLFDPSPAPTRAEAAARLRAARDWEAGYWQYAPLHRYRYDDDRRLIAVENVVE